jgi:rhodanese-related sulfurtransferase
VADPDTFTAAYADGARIAVRDPFEYLAGHGPGAWLKPLARLPRHVGEPVSVIRASGNRSQAAAQLLTRFPSAGSMPGR